MPRGRPKGSKDKGPRKPRKTLAERGVLPVATRRLHAVLADPATVLCACGCGLPAVKGRYYKRGHLPRDAACKCGCGQLCKPGCEYIFGHQWVGKKRPEFCGENNPGAKFGGRPLGVRDGPDADRSPQRILLSGPRNPMCNPEVKARWRKIIDSVEYKTALAEGQRLAHLAGMHGLNDRVEKLLVSRGVLGFEREHLIRWYRADFAWPAEKVVLEVQGCRWHLCDQHHWFWSDISEIDQQKQRKRDGVKRRLLERWGWTVCYLWEHDVMAMPS